MSLIMLCKKTRPFTLFLIIYPARMQKLLLFVSTLCKVSVCLTFYTPGWVFSLVQGEKLIYNNESEFERSRFFCDFFPILAFAVLSFQSFPLKCFLAERFLSKTPSHSCSSLAW